MGKVIERRYIQNNQSNVEFRMGSENTPPQIRGHGAVTNVEQQIFPGFRELIEPGAFEEAIGRDDVRGLWNHDANIVLGRTTSGTLRLNEDEIGLAYSIDPPDTQLVRDMVISPIVRKDVTGSSFGFYVEESTESEHELGGILRTIESLSLVDVSPVTFPAYPDATVAVRSFLSTKPRADALDMLSAILDRDLTDLEVRGLLNDETTANETSEAPAGKEDKTPVFDFRRLRLDLDRLEAEG